MRLDEFLEHSAHTFPDKTAVVAGETRRPYRELWTNAQRLGLALRERCGVKRGDRVVIVLDSRAEVAEAIYAASRIGAVFVVLHPTTRTDKLNYVLNDCGARCLITDAKKLKKLTKEGTLDVPTTVVVDASEPSDAEGGTFAYADLVDEATSMDEVRAGLGERGHVSIDLAALIYTSGSTGNPKGVMLTHQNMDAASRSIITYLENTADDIILSVLPLSFDYGLYQVLMAIRFGGTVVLEKSFAFPHRIMERVVAERATGLPLVPTMAAVLLELDLSAYDLDELRYVTNTAAALPVEHIERLRRALEGTSLYSMYGLTECKRVSYLPPPELDRRPGSVGVAMPDTEAFVVNDAGERAGPGEIGELVVRGANVMLGYWNNPEATQKRLKPGRLPGERWLYTGDLFKTDDEGFLYFVGRTDDIIKSRGEKVAPREIEKVLYKLEGVKDAVVFGIPDVIQGEKVCAVVSKHPGADLTRAMVLKQCKDHLEDVLMPSVVEVREELPHTQAGKIDKLALKAELTESLAAQSKKGPEQKSQGRTK